MRRLAGAAVVPGLGVGHAVLLVRRGRAFRAPVAPERIDDEIARIERARDRCRDQLMAIRTKLAASAGADLAALFDAQLLMLDDPLLVGRAIALVREERANADWAVQLAFEELARLFAEVDDAYLRERGGDVADVVGRLRMNLRDDAGGGIGVLSQNAGPIVLVADDPPPSVTAQLDWSQVVGLAIDAGSRTSHTAILARSLGIPTVVGLELATALVVPGELVALDGTTGELLVQPTEEALAELRTEEAGRPHAEVESHGARHGYAVTRDGVRVRLEANVDRFEDVAAAKRAGANGIGLFRSDFLLLGGALSSVEGVESERAQAIAYRRVVAAFAPGPVTIRTFDLDEAQADAFASSRPLSEIERHQPLGVRGIRLGLARPAMLETQFRAILRAGEAGAVRILLPFVTTPAEVAAARAHLDRARESLAAEGVSAPEVALGAMIEVPAAALAADMLAGYADFLALGTNDLAQYLLAADRTDPRVAGLGQPFHPALMRVLRMLPRLAGRHGLPLSVCGELASDPIVLALLVGFGVREFSMTPSALPAAWRVLEQASCAELVSVARRAATDLSLAPVESYVRQVMGGVVTKT